MAAGDIIILREDAGNARKGNILDGTDDYVLHDAHAVARVAAGDTVGTYTAWIYAEDVDTAGALAILSAGDNDNANEYLLFYMHEGHLKIELKHGGAVQFNIFETGTSIQSKTWTHVAIVLDNGNDDEIFINGKSVASSALSIPFVGNSKDLYLGGDYNNENHFNGYISDFKIWNSS